MRVNKYIAQATGLSRRKVDELIKAKSILVNGVPAITGQQIHQTDIVTLDGKTVRPQQTATIMLHKPTGYVCSRNGQGSKTIYQLLPTKYHKLKPIGRLDKDSSGLLLLTNDGNLANNLTHPANRKLKTYQVELDKPLSQHSIEILNRGVVLEDGKSNLTVSRTAKDKTYQVTMSEGRNRQVRRSFAALGYTVTGLHRTKFGPHSLKTLASCKHIKI